MVGSVRLRLIPEHVPTVSDENGMMIVEEVTKSPIDVGYELTPMMVISSLTFLVGIVQVSGSSVEGYRLSHRDVHRFNYVPWDAHRFRYVPGDAHRLASGMPIGSILPSRPIL